MDYLFECAAQQLPVTGSLYYYAYRRLSKDKMIALYALDQLKYQWVKAGELYHEPYPALEKLKWWQQELGRLKDDKPTVPLAQIIANSANTAYAFQKLSDDLERVIETLAQGREHELLAHFSQNFLGIALIKAEILGCKHAKVIEDLHMFDEITRHILLAGKHYSRGIYLDKSLTPETANTKFSHMANTWLDKAESYRNKALASKDLPRPLKHFSNMQALACRQFIKKVDNPFRQSIHLSPFRLLFAVTFPFKR
ncbi:hypothetical protein [Facilibium subflavum]|uniref:hypothetical protein n=1 Tax=Facilibium subflavum TaxID=2219058 RepID=UPI000E659B27|nr:hypothetical protein [Facilibium subflavum]